MGLYPDQENLTLKQQVLNYFFSSMRKSKFHTMVCLRDDVKYFWLRFILLCKIHWCNSFSLITVKSRHLIFVQLNLTFTSSESVVMSLHTSKNGTHWPRTLHRYISSHSIVSIRNFALQGCCAPSSTGVNHTVVLQAAMQPV